jgi:hypothetical protein
VKRIDLVARSDAVLKKHIEAAACGTYTGIGTRSQEKDYREHERTMFHRDILCFD